MVLATAVVSQALPRRSNRDRYRTLDTFAQALAYISNNYVDRVDERSVLYGGIKGMVSRLDPHSSFLPPRRYKRLRQDTEGQFGGVGIMLTDGVGPSPAPIVDTVIPGSPAALAGIVVDDRLLAIDGRATSGKGVATRRAAAWHSRLRGRAGSNIVLRVLRASWKQPRDLTLVRARVKVLTVDSFSLGAGLGYIAIKKFQEATLSDVRAALRGLRKRSGGTIRGVVLDLRGNPGGLLDQGIAVADLFLDRGIIVSVIGRTAADTSKEYAHARGTWSGFEMVVLVDKGTASSAEILAGALQDHKRAKVLGLTTFGKGSVQTFLDLKDGSGLKLTTARYFTPAGKSLEHVGITPDIRVEAFAGETFTVAAKPAGRDPGKSASTSASVGGSIDAKLQRKLEDDHQLSVGYQTLRASLGSKAKRASSRK